MILKAIGMGVFPRETGRETCITLDKLLNLSMSQLPYPQNEDYKSTYLVGFF